MKWPPLLIFFALLLMAGRLPAEGADWRFLHKDDAFYRSLDFDSIRPSTDGLFLATIIEWALNSKGRERIIGRRIENGLSAQGYELFRKSLISVQVSCERRELSVMERTDYDSNGEVLDSATGDSAWRPILTLPFGDALLEGICQDTTA